LNKIAVVVPRTSGGVSTVYSNLLRGFIKDKVHVKVFRLHGIMPRSILHDIENTKYLRSFDSIIYIGSIPWPSTNLLSVFNTKKILFVHGFIYHEMLSALKKGNLKIKIGGTVLLFLYDIARFLDSIDYYICHSDTTCNMTRVPSEKKILLPQFFLEDDLDFYRSLYYMYKDLKRQDNTVRIITYGSYADSPRLLKIKHIIALAKILKHTTKKIEFVIIDPSSEPYQDEVIKVIKPLPREKYLQLVASSDIYIERCIDEELRYGALEAMAMGTPVAKVTHPLYRSNIDYERALINAQTITGLARIISQVIEQNNLERYSKAGMEYVREKRTWNSVKSELYRRLLIP